jgi:hypothetical protein
MNATLVMLERYNASSVIDRSIAASRGERTAFIAADGTLTHDALRRRGNQMGHLLCELTQ